MSALTIGDIITLARLREFLAQCDNRYAMQSDVKSYGLAISGHTVSIVDGGQTTSVTIPDADTTYSIMSKSEAEDGSSTDARLITGQRVRQSILSCLSNVTWNDISEYS